MNYFKHPNGDIYAYSDQDLINLKDQGKDPISELQLTPYNLPEISPEELEQQAAEHQRVQLIAQAKQLLIQNDFRWNAIKLLEYSDEKKDLVLQYRQSLVDVVNGIATEIPELNLEEVK
jgi:hypothetical protein